MGLITSLKYRDVLSKLHVRLVDTLAGYDEMLKSAEPEILPLLQRFKNLHRSHESELSDRLRAHGCVPDEEGSFFSTVQWAVIKTREMFDEIDEDVLDSVVSGEERILTLYDDTIKAAQGAHDLNLLKRQKDELSEITREARRRSR